MITGAAAALLAVGRFLEPPWFDRMMNKGRVPQERVNAVRRAMDRVMYGFIAIGALLFVVGLIISIVDLVS